MYVLSTYLYIPFDDPQVGTRYILFSSIWYPKTYILYWFEPGTYQYILEKKVCTEYILREKSTYQVQTGLCPFILVPYYSMVHTGMYRY